MNPTAPVAHIKDWVLPRILDKCKAYHALTIFIKLPVSEAKVYLLSIVSQPVSQAFAGGTRRGDLWIIRLQKSGVRNGLLSGCPMPPQQQNLDIVRNLRLACDSDWMTTNILITPKTVMKSSRVPRSSVGAQRRLFSDVKSEGNQKFRARSLFQSSL